MAVTLEQVKKTAALARIDINDGKTAGSCDVALDKLAKQLDNIIDYMDILAHVNTDDVEPLYSPMQHVSGPRPDEGIRKLTPQEVLQNAPESSDTFFVVPQVIS